MEENSSAHQVRKITDAIENNFIIFSAKIFILASLILIALSILVAGMTTWKTVTNLIILLNGNEFQLSLIIDLSIKTLDYFLIAGILYISGAAFWQLFVDEIKKGASTASGNDIYEVSTIDLLKHRLSRLILVILIVKTFEYIIPFLDNGEILLENVYIAVGLAIVVALIAFAIFLSSEAESNKR